ncbi:PDZ domain-containing protein [Ureibacillus sp. Re31]|uniref:PDZ domain-containing protein n=1 Tax=Ureibacillus galli TaxID=2762222 RepID=A0ABR8X7T3_9BACL|nr:PDZ domain-containing protein [Ureibacillus galli]MBD8025379.1 PDZ domain-containing protein [Ureibacillus galli]
MVTEIFLELAIAIGRMFINPLFYLAILMAVYLGYRRVKRERKFFHTRILWGWSETKGLFSEGLLVSLCISILSIAFGLTVSTELLYFVSIVSMIALILYVFHFLSPILIFTVSLVALMIMDYFDWTFTLLGRTFNGMNVAEDTVVTTTLLVGLLLVAEGLLVRKNGANYASPIVENTKRGLKSVAFLSKKIWILPIFFVIPGDAIETYIPWWPQFSLGATQFSFVLFPIVLGFQQMARRSLPVQLYPKMGREISILGMLLLLGGLVAYFEPIVGIICLIAGTIARIILSIIHTISEKRDIYAVSPQSTGVMIAGVLPNSPAEKMGLDVGEVIRKVNGVEVHTERQLYEALQINAAHCRLEVLNHQNEVRLTQHVVYSDDHHRIGLLIAE